MTKRIDSLKESGLIGCLNDSGVTSLNYKNLLTVNSVVEIKSYMLEVGGSSPSSSN